MVTRWFEGQFLLVLQYDPFFNLYFDALGLTLVIYYNLCARQYSPENFSSPLTPLRTFLACLSCLNGHNLASEINLPYSINLLARKCFF